MKYFLLMFLAFSSFSQAQVVESIVAIVNDKIITRHDMARYREQLKSGTIVDDLLGSDPKKLISDTESLLAHMIDESIIDDEVKRQNLFVTIEAVDQEVNSIQRRNGISREQLKSALKKEGVVFSEYQNFIKKRLERQKLISKVITSKIKITDEDVIAYYESKNKALSATKFEFKIAHILFRKDSEERQLERARKIYDQLQEGKDFESLARFSEDPNFNEGGYLGSFKAGEFLKPLEDAVKDLAPGEYSKPIKTTLGYHIVKLLDRKIVTDDSFEKIKEGLRGELYQKAFMKQFQFWLVQKRQESFIRKN